ncbi:hypothetical protein [Polaromonas sp. A23]|uniref:hypothetical protein n=1 Tax=Polaromonas sp. A23 TaxID=1944133 RepID=UPI0009854193|nr:hypothetical protein [Polaromonas sp. A23]OOG46633.1 hypothetical protein B0B52_03105 [Polaromonas sp. A23]
MTSFVNVNHPAEHPGVTRFESALGAARQLRLGFDGAKGLAVMLLVALVAALVVVADQLVENWADGHLLAAWVAAWVVGFAALALFAGSIRLLAARAVAALDAWSSAIAQARADVRLWEAAKADPRVMADLQIAIARHEAMAEAAPAAVESTPAGLTQRAKRLGGDELRAYHRYYV